MALIDFLKNLADRTSTPLDPRIQHTLERVARQRSNMRSKKIGHHERQKRARIKSLNRKNNTVRH